MKKTAAVFVIVAVVVCVMTVFQGCTQIKEIGPATSGYVPTPTPTLSAGGADAFEDDDTYTLAKVVTVNAAATAHTFHDSCDYDYIRFSATAGTQYTIVTSALGTYADTYLILYNTDGISMIDSNDDYTSGLASRIIFTPSVSGVYFARVSELGCGFGAGNNYSVRITSP